MHWISSTKQKGNSGLNEKEFQIRYNKPKIELKKNIQDYILIVSGLLVISKC